MTKDQGQRTKDEPAEPADPSPSWEIALAADLDRLRAAHGYRARRVVRAVDATHVEVDGRMFVNFASNDYLGLTHHPRLIEAAVAATREHGAGSGAAPLVTGYTPAHVSAEAALAEWKGTDAAVLLPSGYQANVAVVQTLAAAGERTAPGTADSDGGGGRGTGGGGVRFLLDKLAHASLIDAVRATGAPFRVYPHNHLSKLERLLADAETGQLQVVVTESIFSMDGDAADLAGLAELKSRRPFVLLLDEAHGSGVYGPLGSGYAAERRLQGCVDVTVVTLSKALGCAGGAVCGSRVFCDALVNHGRAYLFSTAVPPAVAAAAEAGVGVLREEPGRQARVRTLARRVRADLAAAGFTLPPGDSPIVPVILGSESAALAAADRLRDQGLLTVAIRPPTVPRGASRLRVTLSSGHTDNEVDRLTAAIRSLRGAV